MCHKTFSYLIVNWSTSEISTLHVHLATRLNQNWRETDKKYENMRFVIALMIRTVIRLQKFQESFLKNFLWQKWGTVLAAIVVVGNVLCLWRMCTKFSNFFIARFFKVDSWDLKSIQCIKKFFFPTVLKKLESQLDDHMEMWKIIRLTYQRIKCLELRELAYRVQLDLMSVSRRSKSLEP